MGYSLSTNGPVNGGTVGEVFENMTEFSTGVILYRSAMQNVRRRFR